MITIRRKVFLVNLVLRQEIIDVKKGFICNTRVMYIVMEANHFMKMNISKSVKNKLFLEFRTNAFVYENGL